MKRIKDEPYFTHSVYSAFTTGIQVKCPKCHGMGIVTFDEGSAYFKCIPWGGRRCRHYHHLLCPIPVHRRLLRVYLWGCTTGQLQLRGGKSHPAAKAVPPQPYLCRHLFGPSLWGLPAAQRHCYPGICQTRNCGIRPGRGRHDLVCHRVPLHGVQHLCIRVLHRPLQRQGFCHSFLPADAGLHCGGNFTAPPPVGDQRSLALHPVCRIAGRRRVRLLSGKAETKLQLLTQTAGPLMEAGCFIACPDTNNDVAVYLERKYMYSWHLIMPLYSLRRLSAGRPKISSKFSWGLMM